MPRNHRDLVETIARRDALYEAVHPLERDLDLVDGPVRSDRHRQNPYGVNVARIREIRESCGLSIDRAAALAGIGRNTLQRLEAGESDPKVSTLRLLLDLYGRVQGNRIALDEVVE